MSISFGNISIQLKNYYQIHLNCHALGDNLEFAYYVYRDENVIEKFPYTCESSFLYNLTETGEYRVRVFVRDKDGNKIAKTSAKVNFLGFEKKKNNLVKSKVAIYGVSKTSAFIKTILESRYKVLYFVDEDSNKWGDNFFGLEIKDIKELQDNPDIKVIVDEPFSKGINNKLLNYGVTEYEFFDFSLSPNNLVIQTMYDLKSINLYNASRFCYKNGLIQEADYIRDFIQFKFNSFIPYTAEIGEGTRFGYGGVGTIIHKKAKIGKNCVISQNVTIGSRGPLPNVGDNVFIGPGVKCLTGKIGNNVVIGANSVVTKDIPDNCVVAGVPAKIISTDIENYSRYLTKK
ncbi:serine acetyltransferase [Bacillus sp. AFS094611]|uniref:serine O-acetyltransferase n=1 Tax=Bacillus sp. AFS094611 TaxID=2033516 RepID=UPI000BEBDA25|nr:triple tyrosine motif-containing protein [Bacillus sp. AFS094611]PDZ49191.1 serine acetyltransferase [Bacillus sp. AFS094611]PER25259.1 serine acetyltransferase [Bacillus cereus]